MADQKISQLTGATTPLSGTEVLPIVQGGTTKQVSVANITAGRAIAASSATISGDLVVDTTTLKVDSANNRVGVGTATPATTFNTFVNGATNELRVSTTSAGDVRYGFDLDGAFYNWIDCYRASGDMVFAVNNTEAMRITVARNVNLATGNLVIGTSGKGITTGSAIPLGFGVDNSTTGMTLDTSSRLLLGTASYTTSSSQSGEFYSTGSVGFMFTNSTAANYPVSIKNQGTSGTRGLINFYEGTGGGSTRANISFDNSNNFTIVDGGSGGVYLAPGGTSWTAVSDERKKDIIEPISNAANKVSTLRAVIGKYKNDKEGTRRSFLIAQDVQIVLPEAVNTYTTENDETEYLGLSYSEIIPLLVAAIKEIKSELDLVKAQLNEVKK